jgi:hypothetical protein
MFMQPATQLSNIQLELLQLFKRPMSDEDVKAIKRLITAYLAEKVNRMTDEVWEQKGWTEEDMKRLLDTHMRSSVKK